jgi:mutator protein MutT
MKLTGELIADDCSPHSPVVDVSAALIFRAGKILLTQRKAGSHLGGLWEFPGGKRELQESFEECLIREIREELGVTITVDHLFESVQHSYPEKSVRLKFFVCRLLDGEPQPLESAALTWASRDELTSFPFPAADAQLLEKLRNYRTIWHLPAPSAANPGNNLK